MGDVEGYCSVNEGGINTQSTTFTFVTWEVQYSPTDDGFLGDLGSIDNIGEKSCYIQFGIQQPDDI